MNNPYLLLHDTTQIAAMSLTEFEVACRSRCQTLVLGDRVLCRVLGRFLMYTDALDRGVMPHLCLDGYWEAWITIAMTRLLQPGWNCVDIGANHGYYTILMGAISGIKGGRVLAVEPNPRLVDLLQQSVKLNGMQGFVELWQGAIANIQDTMKLVASPTNAMNGSFYMPIKSHHQVMDVEVDTLDHILENWEKVDFVKIDVEGAETEVWQGMQYVIKNNPAITILMEINCARYDNPKAFLQSIEATGFSLQYVDFDAEIKPLTIEQCLTENVGQDWMLYLKQ